MKPKGTKSLYGRIREILEAARIGVVRAVNTTQVVANWMIGREIVEEQQWGSAKARYGERLLEDVSELLAKAYGRGYSATNLCWFRQFFLAYPDLCHKQIHHTVREEFIPTCLGAAADNHHAPRSESWQPGQLHPNLSWILILFTP